MKVSLISACSAALGLLTVQGVKLGPEACVSLDRSGDGACVIRTDCQGLSAALSTFEFAFSCKNLKNSGLVRHSFGVGGFAENEEFDTEIKCDRCLPPVALGVRSRMQHQVSGQSGQQQEQQQQLSKALASAPMMGLLKEPASPEDDKNKGPPEKHQSSESSAADSTVSKLSAPARFGPKACISTYRSAKGNCVLKTDCSSAQLENYKVGFVCIDRLGAPVRHLFRVGSFRTREAFDTLVQCDKCLGTDDIPDAVALNGRALSLSSQVRSLGKMLTEVSSEVKALSENLVADKAGEKSSEKVAGNKTKAGNTTKKVTSDETHEIVTETPKAEKVTSDATQKTVTETPKASSRASTSETSKSTPKETSPRASASETSNATQAEVSLFLSQAKQTSIASIQSLGNLRGWGTAVSTKKHTVAVADRERQLADRERQLRERKVAESLREREMKKKEDLELEDALSSISSALVVAKSYAKVEKTSGGVEDKPEKPSASSKAPAIKQAIAKKESQHGTKSNLVAKFEANVKKASQRAAKSSKVVEKVKAHAKKESRHIVSKPEVIAKRKTSEVHEHSPMRSAAATMKKGEATKHVVEEMKKITGQSSSKEVPQTVAHKAVVFAQEDSEEKNFKGFHGHTEDADLEDDASDASSEALIASALD